MAKPKGPFKIIQPGLYLDADGSVVFSISEILTHVGLEDNPANRVECMETIQEMVGAVAEMKGKGIETQYRLPGDAKWQTGPVPTRKGN